MAGRAESDRYGCHMTLATHYLNKFLKEKTQWSLHFLCHQIKQTPSTQKKIGRQSNSPYNLHVLAQKSKNCLKQKKSHVYTAQGQLLEGIMMLSLSDCNLSRDRETNSQKAAGMKWVVVIGGSIPHCGKCG